MVYCFHLNVTIIDQELGDVSRGSFERVMCMMLMHAPLKLRVQTFNSDAGSIATTSMFRTVLIY